MSTNKMSNFNQTSESTDTSKATALKEISDNLQSIAQLIALHQDLAEKTGNTYYPETDGNVTTLVERCETLARLADISFSMDLSGYAEPQEEDWDSSSC